MRRNSFDVVRLVAAGLVLYGHSFAVLDFDMPRLFGGSVGMLGVAIFFASSGYLIVGSWRADPRLPVYAWKRCLRIAPALVPLGIALAMLAHFGAFSGNPRPDLDPSLWTLPIEGRCYLLVAVLGVLGLLWRPPVTAALYGLFVLLFVLASEPRAFSSILEVGSWLTPKPWGFGVAATMQLTCFLGGALMQFVPRHRVIALAAVAVLLFRTGYPGWVLALPYLVVYLAESRTMQLRRDLSYGLYIWGWPVQQVLVAFGVAAPGAIFPLALTTTAVIAFGSWVLVEQPALRLKPRLQPRPAFSS